MIQYSTLTSLKKFDEDLVNVPVLVRNELTFVNLFEKVEIYLLSKNHFADSKERTLVANRSHLYIHTHNLSHPASATRASASKCCAYVCMWGGIALPSFYEPVS
jgi:hypothetical protein